jgi:hypothetical protein
MELLLASLMLSLLIIGGVFWYLAYGNRKDVHPGFALFKPRSWAPIWRTRSWYSARGYRELVVGSVLIAVGGLVGVFLFLFLRPFH